MKTKGRACGIICMVLTLIYAVYITYFFISLRNYGMDGAFVADLFFWHVVLVAISALLMLIGCLSRNAQWTFLVSGILLIISCYVYFSFSYNLLLLVIIPIVLSFVTYIRMGKPFVDKKTQATFSELNNVNYQTNSSTVGGELPSENKSIEIPAGQWRVGADIPAGEYSVSAENCTVTVLAYKTNAYPYNNIVETLFSQVCTEANPIGKLIVSEGQIVVLSTKAVFSSAVRL